MKLCLSTALALATVACAGGSGGLGSAPAAVDPEAGGEGRGSEDPRRRGEGGTDAGKDDAATPPDDDAEINLSFGGCSPVWNDVQVVTNVIAYDSLAVSSANAPMNGGVQIALKDSTPRTVALSTTQRSSTNNSVVVNVYAGGTTYTNLCNPSPTGCTFDPPSSTWKNDPVEGSFTITEYDPKKGKLQVKFVGVVLASVGGGATCSVNGTLVTKRLSH
jgi:hypothetical protein